MVPLLLLPLAVVVAVTGFVLSAVRGREPGEVGAVWDLAAAGEFCSDKSAQLSEHFHAREFVSKLWPSPGWMVQMLLVRRLETLRSVLGGVPVVVSCGYRSRYHNRAVGGARDSLHLVGMGADVYVPGRTLDQVAAAAKRCGFGAAVVYRRSGFVHVDTGPERSWAGN